MEFFHGTKSASGEPNRMSERIGRDAKLLGTGVNKTRSLPSETIQISEEAERNQL